MTTATNSTANKHWSASPAYTRALLRRAPHDTSLTDLGLWRKCSFTVPDTTPLDRVMFRSDAYRRQFGAALEIEGFDVLYMGEPYQNTLSVHPVDADRRRFEINAWVRRRPIEMKFWIPDNAVPAMQGLGLTLRD